MALPLAGNLRPSLAFPGGNPGFDPAHPASLNLAYAGVATNAGSFISTVAGGVASFSGTSPSAGISSIGPYSYETASYAYVSAPSLSPVTPGFVTTAVICRPRSSAALQILFSSTSATNATAYGLYLASLAVGVQYGGNGSGVPGITLTAGTPYFIAVSADGYTAQTEYFVVCNLRTGQIQSATTNTSCGSTPGASSGNVAIGGRNYANNQSLCEIAAVMQSVTKLSPMQLLQWAQRPWDFWYPPTSRALFAAFSKPSSIASPIWGWEAVSREAVNVRRLPMFDSVQPILAISAPQIINQVPFPDLPLIRKQTAIQSDYLQPTTQINLITPQGWTVNFDPIPKRNQPTRFDPDRQPLPVTSITPQGWYSVSDPLPSRRALRSESLDVLFPSVTAVLTPQGWTVNFDPVQKRNQPIRFDPGQFPYQVPTPSSPQGWEAFYTALWKTPKPPAPPSPDPVYVYAAFSNLKVGGWEAFFDPKPKAKPTAILEAYSYVSATVQIAPINWLQPLDVPPVLKKQINFGETTLVIQPVLVPLIPQLSFETFRRNLAQPPIAFDLPINSLAPSFPMAVASFPDLLGAKARAPIGEAPMAFPPPPPLVPGRPGWDIQFPDPPAPAWIKTYRLHNYGDVLPVFPVPKGIIQISKPSLLGSISVPSLLAGSFVPSLKGSLS